MRAIASIAISILLYSALAGNMAVRAEGNVDQTVAASSVSDAASLFITEIRVSGNRLVPEQEILDQVKTKIGDRFDRDLLTDDLRAINAMGCFDPNFLRISPYRDGARGVGIVIDIRENPPLSEVRSSPEKGVQSTRHNCSCTASMPQFAQYNLGGYDGIRGYRQFNSRIATYMAEDRWRMRTFLDFGRIGVRTRWTNPSQDHRYSPPLNCFPGPYEMLPPMLLPCEYGDQPRAMIEENN